MDAGRRRMLADLGLDTRNAVVTSINAKERHDGSLRSQKRMNGPSDPIAIPQSWIDLQLARGSAAQDADTPAHPPTHSNAQSQTADAKKNNAQAPQTPSKSGVIRFSRDAMLAIRDTGTSQGLQGSFSHKASPSTPRAPSKARNTVASSSMKGSLTTTFYNVAGSLIGHFHTEVNVPVQANAMLISKTEHLGTNDLTRMAENLTYAMEMPTQPVMNGVYEDGTGVFDVEEPLIEL